MKKLGKLTALWLCWELWDWCARTGGDKADWPGWERTGGTHGCIEHDCFACEYKNQYIKKYACLCATKTDCIIPIFAKLSCMHDNSVFQLWKDPKHSKKYARIIANSAYKEYKKLGGKRVK